MVVCLVKVMILNHVFCVLHCDCADMGVSQLPSIHTISEAAFFSIELVQFIVKSLTIQDNLLRIDDVKG